MHFNCLCCLIIIFIYCCLAKENQQKDQQYAKLQENTTWEYIIDEEMQGPQEKLLTRKKRYLEFPEGSSFQIVYDLIIGVVDYTNYLILGVTVALAWELPSKPPSEILNDLRERLKEGTLGTTRNDTISQITYADTKTPARNYWRQHTIKSFPGSAFRVPMHYKYYTPHKAEIQVNAKTFLPKYHSYYNKWSNDLHKSSNLSKYPWWNLSSRLREPFEKHLKRPGYLNPYYESNLSNKYQHNTWSPSGTGRAIQRHVFPIFGKRNTLDKEEKNQRHLRYKRHGIKSQYMSKWDRIHIRYQRSSRHELYEKIEKYLEKRGCNGHHCVLRALCETGQKATEVQPGSFVGELMRAVFTIPEPLPEDLDSLGYKEKRYDVANALTGNCATRYHLCKESLWASHFVM
ncbi:uncharacterized protein LOC119638978 [Glossina fuscipes]|uniref:Uncharacterized protein LOC119638978 n=1 Tax=Glossina fuscipes TaxID=7396 RepID=A0A9C5Z903_9MUSC|nr:uncharacterized protein LOC119638978 [Glossina fuscipes]XP_037892076.1 uncharacterized protein LOC119638978 [Glossina fuscipes]